MYVSVTFTKRMYAYVSFFQYMTVMSDECCICFQDTEYSMINEGVQVYKLTMKAKPV